MDNDIYIHISKTSSLTWLAPSFQMSRMWNMLKFCCTASALPHLHKTIFFSPRWSSIVFIFATLFCLELNKGTSVLQCAQNTDAYKDYLPVSLSETSNASMVLQHSLSLLYHDVTSCRSQLFLALFKYYLIFSFKSLKPISSLWLFPSCGEFSVSFP